MGHNSKNKNMAETTEVVIVTGASVGLGAAICVAAAQAGMKVYATARKPEATPKLDAALEAGGVSVAGKLALDVTSMESIESAVAAVVEAEGYVSCVVANAGMGFVVPTETATEEEVVRVMDVNFHGVVRCAKAVMPHFRAAERKTRFVAITSVGGLVGQPFNEVYCASKFAVEGWIESMATYVGPEFDIAFTAVEPGGISSEFATRVKADIQNNGSFPPDSPYTPLLGRYLAAFQARSSTSQTPAEVAAVVLRVLQDDQPPVRIRSSPHAEEFCSLKTAADPTG